MIRVTVDGKLVKQGLQNLNAKIPRIGKNQIYLTMVRVRGILKKPGVRPTYPIPWDSIRQKIKVLIILKHVLGIPYRRTGGYQKAFKIVTLKTGYGMENETERAQYLGGDAEGEGQSRIAKGRYPITREVMDREVQKLPAAVVQYIQLAAREEGFE